MTALEKHTFRFETLKPVLGFFASPELLPERVLLY